MCVCVCVCNFKISLLICQPFQFEIFRVLQDISASIFDTEFCIKEKSYVSGFYTLHLNILNMYIYVCLCVCVYLQIHAAKKKKKAMLPIN